MDINKYLELLKTMKGKIVKVVTLQNDIVTGLWKSTQINDRTGELRMVIEVENNYIFINRKIILTIEKAKII